MARNAMSFSRLGSRSPSFAAAMMRLAKSGSSCCRLERLGAEHQLRFDPSLIKDAAQERQSLALAESTINNGPAALASPCLHFARNRNLKWVCPVALGGPYFLSRDVSR
jgi:hypothetical protein